tara:strand:- start:401 stop:1153 length:753 start_codon:yes stop_codon:yes gene_type:complete
MKIYISTCDSHDRVLKPFSYLFNKFWNIDQEVNILGYRTPPFDLPSNFNFISIGEKQISVNHWSTDLYNFFSTIEDEHFIFTLEDLFICDYVDMNIFEKLIENLDENTGRIALVNTFQKHCNWKESKNYKNFKVGTANNSRNKFSLIWSLFNRQWFLKYVLPKTQEQMNNGEGSPWHAEISGDAISINDGWDIKGSIDIAPIKFACGVRAGNGLSKPFDFTMTNESGFLDERVVQEMINKKLISTKRTMI